MSVLKQRVPLTTDGKFISLEWLKDLRQEIADAGGSSSSVDLAALTTEVAVLEADLAALIARVVKLETGYQS